ncbi:hypothetical protein J7K92_00100 [bacterium]|nr:hypothetical protein [bacterium]
MKYHIITFGCQMNKNDSQRIARILEMLGFKKASKEDEADLVVVNMCSVRQSAVDRAFSKTQNAKRKTTTKSCAATSLLCATQKSKL